MCVCQFSLVHFSRSVVSDSVRPHRWQPTRLPHSWDSPGKNAGVGCHFLLQCMKVKSESEVAQLCCAVLSHSVESDSLRPHESQHARPSLSITNSRSSLRLTSIESVMQFNHLILWRPLLLLPPIPPSIRVFSNESTLHMRWPSTGVSALASFLPKKSQG